MRLTKTIVIAVFIAVILSVPVCIAAPAGKDTDAGRVNNLANLEALLNIIANGGEILGLACGCKIFPCGIALLFLPERRFLGAILAFGGLVIGTGGLALPGIINWLVQSARDANLLG
jgi:hypothetical protein